MTAPAGEPVTPEPVAPELVTPELVAVVVAVGPLGPQVLTRPSGAGRHDALPSGPLRTTHRSLQAGVRAWVETQTGLRLGHVEQLYTFADRARAGSDGRLVISVSYLGLTRIDAPAPPTAPRADPTRDQEAPRTWSRIYAHFPWEDRRDVGADHLDPALEAALRAWAALPGSLGERRRARCAATFGLDGSPWLPDLCLQRYELLWEAGLVAESVDRGEPSPVAADEARSGVPLQHDHRRILSTGLARLRATIQYRPVVFELLPDAFTLGELQACVEAVAGTRVHTQNFRRLIQQQSLVEETGEVDSGTGGRPARLFRFRGEVHALRQATGTKLPIPRRR